MTELIFVLIALIIYIVIRIIPGYTPEQVGSNKWIVRRKPMKAPGATETKEVVIARCSPDQAWYRDNVFESVTVIESGTDGDYYIADGKHEGKHVAKADCI